jgi:hypothetical protein
MSWVDCTAGSRGRLVQAVHCEDVRGCRRGERGRDREKERREKRKEGKGVGELRV